jgi:hypothetical protein
MIPKSKTLPEIDRIRQTTGRVYRAISRRVSGEVESLYQWTESIRPSTNPSDAETRSERPYILESIPVRDSNGQPYYAKERARTRVLDRLGRSMSEAVTISNRVASEADRPIHRIAWVKGAPHPLTLGRYTPEGEGDRDPLRLACASAGAVSRDHTPEAVTLQRMLSRLHESDSDLIRDVEHRLAVITPKHRGKRGGRRGRKTQG